VIKLEQNYRSTKSILNAANEVICNNQGRKDKSLWTENEEGEPVHFTQFDTDYLEADSITSEIKRAVENGEASYKDFAVLYRTNAQSRLFEEKLVLKNVPYKIIGGVNFYARKEIKDILAYLKTINNGLDSLSVKRIINVPRRGIGLTTVDRINDYAVTNDLSFYDALTRAHFIPGLERTASKLTPFVSLIEGLKSRMSQEGFVLRELIDDILDATGYLKELEEEGAEEAQDRIGNINELVNKLVAYEENSLEQPTLGGFLEEVALVSDIDNLDEDADKIVLMTLHSAKGLEFPYVYLCGMEEGVFPSYMSIFADNPTEEIEEERRLCYVGITRAMKQLSITAAKQRMLRGETQFNKPSRFVHEIPRYLMKMTTPELRKSQSSIKDTDYTGSKSYNFGSNNDKLDFDKSDTGAYKQSQASYKPFITPTAKQFEGNNMGNINYGVGDTVKHIKFGVGIVIDITKGGKDFEITVDFPNFGVKKLLSTFANLIKID
jgi:DNA helicase-2/ATP-dependent DNA helicase PcrA